MKLRKLIPVSVLGVAALSLAGCGIFDGDDDDAPAVSMADVDKPVGPEKPVVPVVPVIEGPTPEEIAAEGMRVAMAIGPDSEPPTDDQPFTADGGELRDPGIPTDMADDFTKSTDAPAEIHGWTGAMYTRTTDLVTDTVYSYTDQAEPTALAYSVYYNEGRAIGEAAIETIVENANAENVITFAINGDVSGASMYFAGDALPDGARTYVVFTDEDEEDTVNERMFEGMFHGVPGTFACTGTDECRAENDAEGNLAMLKGTWTFTPTEREAEADAYMVAGVDPDSDYLDFGYWLQATEDEHGEVTYAVLPYANGNRTYGSVEEVDGKATYVGPATGLYMKKIFTPTTDGSDVIATPVASGQFTADTSLTAYFGQLLNEAGDGTISADMLYSISGTVSDFMNSDGVEIDGNWMLTLDEGIITKDDDTFMGTTAGTGDNPGVYEGTFNGNPGDAMPSAASGTFDGHFVNGHVLGAFGANIVVEE